MGGDLPPVFSTTPSEICITAAEFKWIRVAFPWTLNLHQVSGAGSAGAAGGAGAGAAAVPPSGMRKWTRRSLAGWLRLVNWWGMSSLSHKSSEIHMQRRRPVRPSGDPDCLPDLEPVWFHYESWPHPESFVACLKALAERVP
uniref:HDC06109 n=1 Tax=Drosophila melanogaster TaxID=7227 RepID=Q6IGK2_DROME|nr:TPA_inf: HDC06109 [Drosophila melanogaster]